MNGVNPSAEAFEEFYQNHHGSNTNTPQHQDDMDLEETRSSPFRDEQNRQRVSRENGSKNAGVHGANNGGRPVDHVAGAMADGNAGGGAYGTGVGHNGERFRTEPYPSESVFERVNRGGPPSHNFVPSGQGLGPTLGSGLRQSAQETMADPFARGQQDGGSMAGQRTWTGAPMSGGAADRSRPTRAPTGNNN